MSIECEEVLRKLYEKAISTSDLFIVNCDIRVRAEKREKVCSWLKENGFISDYTLIGKTYIQCHVLQKTLDYFANR